MQWIHQFSVLFCLFCLFLFFCFGFYLYSFLLFFHRYNLHRSYSTPWYRLFMHSTGLTTPSNKSCYNLDANSHSFLQDTRKKTQNHCFSMVFSLRFPLDMSIIVSCIFITSTKLYICKTFPRFLGFIEESRC